MTKLDTFRFIRAALGVRTKTPAQKLILLTLAIRADGKTGVCHPSYESLSNDTGLARSSVADAVRYLRDTLKVLNWKQGHCNQHMKPLANLYTLDCEAMQVLSPTSELSNPKSAESDLQSAESDSQVAESDSALAESAGRTPTTQVTTTQDTTTKVFNSCDSPSFVFEKPTDGRKPEKAQGAALSPIGGPSTLGPMVELSTVMPECLEHDGHEWVARRGIGRALTADEIATLQRLNRERVRS